jgi:hypothetical protein
MIASRVHFFFDGALAAEVYGGVALRVRRHVELLDGPMVMNAVNQKDKGYRGRRNKGEDKDMIRRAVQIKRKLEVKEKKGPVLSEGIKTKRRGGRGQRCPKYKVAVKAEKKWQPTSPARCRFIAQISRAS